MRSILVLFIFVWFAGPGSAQDFSLRDGDVVFDTARMQMDVVGQTHEFFDGGRAFFSISGSYSYTYPDGGVAYGNYEVRDGGVVCTRFNHGFSRCDVYVENAGRWLLINEAGDRFPVRSQS